MKCLLSRVRVAGIGDKQASEVTVRRSRFVDLADTGIALNTGNALNWWITQSYFEARPSRPHAPCPPRLALTVPL